MKSWYRQTPEASSKQDSVLDMRSKGREAGEEGPDYRRCCRLYRELDEGFILKTLGGY